MTLLLAGPLCWGPGRLKGTVLLGRVSHGMSEKKDMDEKS